MSDGGIVIEHAKPTLLHLHTCSCPCPQPYRAYARSKAAARAALADHVAWMKSDCRIGLVCHWFYGDQATIALPPVADSDTVVLPSEPS